MQQINPRHYNMIAARFDALGHTRRIKILAVLLAHDPKPITFSALAAATKLQPSVLAHHIRKMKSGGLIKPKQVGSFTEFRLERHSYHSTINMLGALQNA